MLSEELLAYPADIICLQVRVRVLAHASECILKTDNNLICVVRSSMMGEVGGGPPDFDPVSTSHPDYDQLS